MDLVITNVSDNKNNIELLFCLRSIEKSLKGYRNIVIIGDLPNWINTDKVIHYPFAKSEPKAANIADRLLFAANQRDITANFIHFTDDVMVLNPIDVSEINTYHKGEIEEKQKGSYGMLLVNSKKIFAEKKLSVLNFDTHYPFPFNKTKLKKAYQFFNYKSEPLGILTRSMYGNFNKIKSQEVEDCKTNNPNNVINLGFISTKDDISVNVLRYLSEKFKEKSSFETPEFNLKLSLPEATHVLFEYNGKNNITGRYNLSIKNAKLLQKDGYGTIIN